MADEMLDVPPFPPLRWDEYFWVGEVTLPSWAGFQTRRGVRRDQLAIPVGRNRASQHWGRRSEAARAADRSPNRERCNTCSTTNLKKTASPFLQALFEAYPDDEQAGYDGDEQCRCPISTKPNGLQNLDWPLSNSHPVRESKDGARVCRLRVWLQVGRGTWLWRDDAFGSGRGGRARRLLV